MKSLNRLPRVEAKRMNEKGTGPEINMRNRNFVKKCFIYEILLTLRNLKRKAAERRWKMKKSSLKGTESVSPRWKIRFTVEIKRKFFLSSSILMMMNFVFFS